MENQQERMDKHMKQLTETHRQKIAMLESQFLQQKQQLLRGMLTTSHKFLKPLKIARTLTFRVYLVHNVFVTIFL